MSEHRLNIESKCLFFGYGLYEFRVKVTVNKPGTYGVEATDRSGAKTAMEYIKVEYKGIAPYIIRQPESVKVK